MLKGLNKVENFASGLFENLLSVKCLSITLTLWLSEIIEASIPSVWSENPIKFTPVSFLIFLFSES